MNYNDIVYGATTIENPILQDLIQSSAMRRLKNVLQHGITGLIGVTQPVTRFQHSMGVMLLVRQLGGSQDEQIAALLHDVSHTAFSHVVDYVYADHDGQGYHDRVKQQYVSQTDLPAAFARHGLNWRNYMDETAFPILEQPAPRLCADRVDYFLRDSLELGLATPQDVADVLANLVIHNGRLAVNNIATAQWLGRTYIQADDSSWANFREVGLYELAARAIKTGLRLGVMAEADFWSTDKPVWKMLNASDNFELQSQMRLVSPDTQFVWDEEAPTFHVSTKIRTIDPDVLIDNALHPLSTLDEPFATFRQEYIQRKTGQWPMRVIPPALI